jgi:hypothetical protein
MDTNAWTQMHGHKCMDTNAWTQMHGHKCMDTHAWTQMHGHTCINKYKDKYKKKDKMHLKDNDKPKLLVAVDVPELKTIVKNGNATIMVFFCTTFLKGRYRFFKMVRTIETIKQIFN